jgi:hypothetical protein
VHCVIHVLYNCALYMYFSLQEFAKWHQRTGSQSFYCPQYDSPTPTDLDTAQQHRGRRGQCVYSYHKQTYCAWAISALNIARYMHIQTWECVSYQILLEINVCQSKLIKRSKTLLVFSCQWPTKLFEKVQMNFDGFNFMKCTLLLKRK